MRVIGIIQARLSSQRFPGKALLEIGNAAMLYHVYSRVRRAKTLDAVVIATSFAEADLQLVYWCQRADIPVYRGGVSEDDVLGRYYDTAINTGADVIVRICGDCPLIDPAIIDQCVDALLAEGADYVSNVHPPQWPDGTDTEVFPFNILAQAHENTTLWSEREHVTPWIGEHATKQVNIGHDPDWSGYRLCVDTEEDLTLVRAIYAAIGREEFGTDEIVDLLEARPELVKLNAGQKRNEGYGKSLRLDKKWAGR